MADRPPHPADLPCIDPDCIGSLPGGPIVCQRCAARIERAKRDHRLRYQTPSLPGIGL